MSNTRKKQKPETNRPVGRPPAPLASVAFEKERDSLKRMFAQGELRPNEFNDKYEALLTRFREGR